MRTAAWLSVACLIAVSCTGTTPSSAPAPAPTPAPNRAPVVTLAFQGASSCAPVPPLVVTWAKACSVTVIAQATDPDGDPLTYKWSGCVSKFYTSTQASCNISEVGPATATVEVSDGQTHTATASIAAQGLAPSDFVNHPPIVAFSGLSTVNPQTVHPRTGTATMELYGNISDPDEGTLCDGSCTYLKAVSVSGDCQTNKFYADCTCLSGLEVDVYRTQPSGTCALTFTVRDSWGLSTTATFTLPYQTTGLFAALTGPLTKPFLADAATRPLKPIKPARLGNTCSASVRSTLH